MFNDKYIEGSQDTGVEPFSQIVISEVLIGGGRESFPFHRLPLQISMRKRINR